jgi:hypothetical protein
MRLGTRWFLAAGFVASAALVASGCSGGCPFHRLFMQGYDAIAGTGGEATAGAPGGDPNAPKAQTTCPIMGGRISKRLYVDYEGKRIYMCCPGCRSAIRKDPAKYIQQLEAKGVVLDRVPVAQ